jgi:hypothetical protein
MVPEVAFDESGNTGQNLFDAEAPIFTIGSVRLELEAVRAAASAIEIIAPGWRARETNQLVGEDELVEVFALAAPGKDFEVYSETRLKRKK